MSTEVTTPVCYRHPEREAAVRCTRCDRLICPECMRDAPVGFQCPDCAGAGSGRPTRRAAAGYRGPVAGAAATWALVAANVAVFIATAIGGTSLFFGGSGDTSPLYRDMAMQPVVVAASGEYYRLLTAMFLHWGLLHIAFNMWALVYIGPPLEAALGRLRFLVLYLLAGIGGSVASYAFGPPLELAAGASGAIFGLFGAYAVLARQQRRDIRAIVFLIVINLVFTFAAPGIDWRAHLGGLGVGAVLGAAFAYLGRGRQRSPARQQTQRLAQRLAQPLCVAAVGLVLVGAVLARTQQLRGELHRPAAAGYPHRPAAAGYPPSGRAASIRSAAVSGGTPSR